MAQASGGTAGSSSSRGDGGMGGRSSSSRGGNGNGGGQGSNAKGGNSGNSSTGAKSSATQSGQAKSTAAAASTNDSSKQSGGVMGGLMGAVNSARSAKASTAPAGGTNVQGAVNSAFASSESAAPAAARAGKTMSNIAAQGYDSAMNRGMTESAFGVGGMPGALAGKAIGAVTASNPYGKNTPESEAFSAGERTAKDAGLSTGTKGLASLAAGVLGGPIGSALAGLALGGVSYGMQQRAREGALPGIGKTTTPNPGNPTNASGSVGNNLSGQGNSGNGGGMASAMGAAATTPVADPFEFATDYTKDRQSYQNLNLGSII